ncbi:AvrE-family type 3 secretion system effector [Pectobacterium brasiliense]|uniref:AvrE-family type 3 secretion system effector n=1 Tax=Pectobacterium brasiliense TaxID=180957 RepID=UPI00094A80EC|nr:AvrE-family type 3 secretion system effector [Pectobacterium brasiliense]APS30229.1 avirulence protein [Pectobacterium brasiliense]MBN3103546.1 AvrE-family type 3 secretion system effector [Pectobacterium brasiliense]
MQKIQHVQPGLSVSEIAPATLANTSLSQGSSTSASQKGAQSLIQQGLHDKNKPPELEQGSGSSVKSQDSRSTTLRELFSSEGVSQSVARAPRDSLASGGPIQSLPRFASTEAAEIKISGSHTATPAAKSDIALDSHGKLQFGKGLPEALSTLLQQTIGKNSQPFVAHHENQDAQQHALADKSGRLFVIQSDDNQHIALHSSGRSAMPAGKLSASNVQLDSTPERISLTATSGESTSVPLSGRMNHELLTGVHRQPDSASGAGEQLRLHDGKLFALNTEFGVWQQSSDVAHSQLSRQGDGQLYAVKDDHTLSNLSSGTESSAFSDKITAFSANQNGQSAVLTAQDHLTQLHLMSTLDAAPQPVDLKLDNGEPVYAKAVGLTAEHLLIADNDGKLYHAPLPEAGASHATLTPTSTPELNAVLGDEHRITGFAHDEHGQTQALATDRQGQKHVAPLGQNGLSPTPGWNLSDSLVVDNKLGLTTAAPEAKDTLDLGRLGQVGLQEGKVHFYNGNTKSWEASSVEASQLKRGLDNQAYTLKDGEIKPLSINQKSDSFTHGDNTVFALPQVRMTPSAGTALPGIAKDDDVSAMAVINRNKFIAVDKQGDLHFHQIKPGTDKLAAPPLALPKNGLSGEIQDIALDHQQTLFALNKDGQLFQLPKADWQNAANHDSAQWQPVKTPAEGKVNSLGTNAQHHVQVAHDEHELHTLQGSAWKTTVPKGEAPLPAEPRAAEAVFGRLDVATKGGKIPLTGVTYKADVQVLGKTGEESQQVKSKLSDLLRAHLVSFTLDVPRPLKTFADHVQHQVSGREGLKPVYDMQTELLKKLDATTSQPQGEAMDLASKLDKLDLGEKGKPLVNLLKQFHTELESSSAKAVLLIGRQQGVVNDNGVMNTEGKPASLHGREKDLAPVLLAAMESHPSSKTSTAGTLIKAFVDSKTPIAQKPNSESFGQQRDTSDALSLAKTRLVLDTLVLGDLHKLTDRIDTLSGTSPGEAALASMMKELNALRQGDYGENPVKKMTDMGFTNHKSLEADYDSVKTFMKAFRKEDNAVSVTSKTVMQATSQTDMIDKMKATVLSLDSNESIAFNRTYGGGASMSFVVSGTPLPFPPVPGGGVSGERNYNLSFSRGENGINVAFERSGGITGKVSYSGGYDVSQYLTGKTSAQMTQSINSKHSFTPDVRASFGVSASLQMAQQNALNFTLSEEELPGFIDGLSSGTINPLALLDKGEQHSVKAGKTVSFNLDGNAALELRAGINLTEKGAAPTSATLRGSVGVTASANVLSAASSSSVAQGEKSTTYTESDNRLRFMNQAAMGANATLSAGAARTTPEGTVPFFTSASIGVNVAADSRTNQSISLGMKKAEPLENKDIEALTKTLASAFSDPASQLLIDSVKKVAEPGDQLAILNEHFAGKTAKTDDQHQGLMNLQKLNVRQDVAQRDGATLDSVKHTTSYTNLSKLTENGLFQVIGNHLFSSLPPSNADRINQLIADNPALKDIVSRLQDNDRASVTVSLELKDDVREKIEKGIQNKTHGKDDVIALFKDGNNLRLASIEVSKAVKKSEGFNTPAVIINASSSAGVSMNKLLGNVSFSYGQDQTVPQSYKLSGEIAKANPATANALQQLQQEGLQLNG